MDFSQIKELMNAVNDSELREFELKTEKVAVRMSKNTYTSMPTHALLDTNRTEPEQPVSLPACETVSEPVSSETKETVPEKEEMKEGHIVEAPIVGVVYLAPSPDQPVYKTVGDRVEKGETLCIIEAMKIMNEIKSDRSGTIEEVLVENEQPVEFGQPLFRLKEEA